MELLSLYVSNFRQFESIDGEPQKIDFAGAGEKNVTAIYGTNGAGKSGLLNAFTWVLFGKTTKALKHPWNLVNQRALKAAPVGSMVKAIVRLDFKAKVNGQQVVHRLERSVEYQAPGILSSNPESDPAPLGRAILTYNRPGMGTTVTEDPTEIKQHILQIIPEELFQYFFIDGERIANLTKPENEEDVRHAVEVFVGLQELERGSTHLREAADTFDKEVLAHEKNNNQLKLLLEKKKSIESTIKQHEDGISNDKATVVEIEKDIKAITDNLEQNKGTRLIEEERKTIHSKIEAALDKQKVTESELFREILQKGWSTFGLEGARYFLETNIELRKKGDLPYRIRRPFIQELIDRLSCICGRNLDINNTSPEHRNEVELALKTLNAELEKPDLSTIQNQLFGATTAAVEVNRERTDLQSLISAKNNILSDLSAKIEQLRAEYETKTKSLRETEDARELVARRETLETKLKDKIGQIAIGKANLDREKNNLTKVETELETLEVTSDAGMLARTRATACRKVASAMACYLENEKQEVRSKLEKRIRQIFQKFSITGYTPKVSEGYTLSLVERIGDHEVIVSDSTGEGQTLSLAFITGVAEAATERRKDEVFSIVIDSQFGALDNNYHRRIGTTLPTCVGQVVLIQTKTQWSEEMRSALKNRIGAEVVLTRRVTRELSKGLTTEDGRELEVDEMISVETGNLPYVELSDTDSTFIRMAR